jgi:ABC-type bacteriocin/lantibiotic exporter with double-glycine peptidase domain
VDACAPALAWAQYPATALNGRRIEPGLSARVQRPANRCFAAYNSCIPTLHARPVRGDGVPGAKKPAMQYIYTMNGVSKTVPPKRQIIKDISLSFFPGAKIGLLGLNGAGKSTVPG